jgi:hypothetical protein
MRVRDLRAVLGDIQRVFKVSGAKTQEAALAKLATTLRSQDGRDLDSYLKALEDEIQAASLPPAAAYFRELEAIGFNEQAFKDLADRLERDRTLGKSDLVAIVERYTGSADRRTTMKKLIKQLRAHFYAKLYERDANALAKRATPV